MVETGVQAGFTRFGAGKPEPIALAGSVAHQLNTNQRRNGWVYLANTSTQPDTLYYAASLNTTARALDTPALVPANLQSASSQVVRWNNESGKSKAC